MWKAFISVLHIAIGVLAVSAWAFGMYYWYRTNEHLKRGVSKFVLFNPAAYWNRELFTSDGIYMRNRAIASFLLMFLLGIAAYGLRLLKEVINAT